MNLSEMRWVHLLFGQALLLLSEVQALRRLLPLQGNLLLELVSELAAVHFVLFAHLLHHQLPLDLRFRYLFLPLLVEGGHLFLQELLHLPVLLLLLSGNVLHLLGLKVFFQFFCVDPAAFGEDVVAVLDVLGHVGLYFCQFFFEVFEVETGGGLDVGVGEGIGEGFGGSHGVFGL